MNEGSAAYQRSIQSGKMVLHIFIFFVPGGLIADRRRIIAFGFSLHGKKGQMRYAYGYAKRGLPVSLEFMSPEVKIPIGNAVQLRKLRFAAVLVDGRLHLLERGKFQAVAQHIDARDSERTVRTHRISGRMRLCKQIVLLHDMSRKVNLILAAPRADIVGKRAGEPFRNMVVESISGL